jgi:thiol-disulfide isomerase/thioredoxin
MLKFARAFVIVTLALTIAAVTAACAQPAKETRTEPVPAPDFSIQDLQGNTLDLASYKGKVLVVNFWATWCPPCRKEIPDFVEAYKELKGEGLEILGLSVDDDRAGAHRMDLKDGRQLSGRAGDAGDHRGL